MSRRAALLSCGSAIVGLTGCVGVSGGNDVPLITNSIDAIAKAILALPGLSAQLKSEITTALSALDAAGKAISGSMPTSFPSEVQTFLTAVKAVLAIVDLIPGLPPWVTVAAAAVTALLPAISAVLLSPAAAAVAAAAPAPLPAATIQRNYAASLITAEHARAILMRLPSQ